MHIEKTLYKIELLALSTDTAVDVTIDGTRWQCYWEISPGVLKMPGFGVYWLKNGDRFYGPDIPEDILLKILEVIQNENKNESRRKLCSGKIWRGRMARFMP
jgi:hypothetical protein